jgi:hypothetical protein
MSLRGPKGISNITPISPPIRLGLTTSSRSCDEPRIGQKYPTRQKCSIRPALEFWQANARLSSRDSEGYKQQGLFAPRTLLRFLATTDPAESLSPSTDFPVLPVIRLPCSADFSTGRGGFLQFLGMTLSPCCPYRPRRSVSPHQSLRRSMLPSPEK